MSTPIADDAIFTSKPFSFIVEGKPLYAHAALVSNCSEPFSRMIKGHLAEAQQGFAVLDDVDESTFTGFIRWIYSKDYPSREHYVEPKEEGGKGDDPVVTTYEEEGWGWGSWGKKDKKKKKKTEPAVRGYLRESFVSEQRNAEKPFTIAPARANKGPEEDYTEVFLGHARMYIFAEKYDIQPLKKLALQKLQHQLAIHTLYIDRVGDIFTLLRYVYANTAEPAGGQEDMRAMLVHYIGVEMANLVKDDEMKELMLEEPDLLSDFLKMFANRVN